MTRTGSPVPDLSLYLVTDAAQVAAAGRSLPATVAAAVAGGVRTVQVRDKHASARELLAAVRAVARAAAGRATVLVNDRVDVCAAARHHHDDVAGLDPVPGVHGVHLGQSDLSPAAARAILGEGAVIGVSAATPTQLLEAAADPAGVAYVGVGAVHPTPTKPDAPPPLGADGFAALARGCPVPAVAIGGVRVADVAPLRRRGAVGVAVVSGICAALDPEAAARAYRAAWDLAAEVPA